MKSVCLKIQVIALAVGLAAVTIGTSSAQMAPMPYAQPGGPPMTQQDQQAFMQQAFMQQAMMQQAMMQQQEAMAAEAAYQQAVSEYEAVADPDVACPSCDGGGCEACVGTGHGLSWWNRYCPQGGCSGICTPRWFDFSIEFLNLTRDDVSRFVPFSAQGVGGPIVLSTDDLDFGEAPGARLQANIICGPARHLEIGYFGFHNWADSAQVVSAQPDTAVGDLFSAFSNFGLGPFGGFTDADFAHLHRIEYSSRLDSVELSLRGRWTSENCRWHGSRMIGARYIRVDENFAFRAREAGAGGVPPMPLNQRTDYEVRKFNDLIGLQFGGDLFLAPTSNLRVGGDLKVGAYGNSAHQKTFISATTVDPSIFESETNAKCSFVAEANLTAVYIVNSRLSLRAGYTVAYIDGLALGPENFNATPPGDVDRTPVINVNGSALYHGYHAGAEWTW